MECDTVKEKLLLHQCELNDAGIVHIFLHGSVARGESTPTSDVDLIADLNRSKRFTLFDLAGLEARLSDILDKPVDLSGRRMLKERFRVRAEREALLVF